MKAPIKTIRHETLSSSDFIEFAQSLLKNRYKVKTVNIGRFSSCSFISGFDLLGFYFAYQENNEDHLPKRLTIYHGPDFSKGIEGCENVFLSGDIEGHIVGKFQVNCFQASFNIFTGVVKGSISFSHFLSAKQIELGRLFDAEAALKEAVAAARFQSLYFNGYAEVNVLATSVVRFNYNGRDKEESRNLKMFFARLLVTDRSKSVAKINRLIHHQAVFRVLALKSGYHINEFDYNLKKTPKEQELKRLEVALQLEFVWTYIIESSEPAYQIFEELSELYPYFRDYPKAMEKIYEYFVKNNLGKFTKEKVERLLKDPESRKSVGEYFDAPKEPLSILKFTKDPGHDVTELLSSFDLTRAGKEMGHCLGSEIFFRYQRNSTADRYFTLKTKASKSTLHIVHECGSWHKIEHRAKFNQYPNPEHNSLADAFIEFLNTSEILP